MHTVVFAASEPSKVAWYIAGGVLAVYAVALSAVGLRNPGFPYSTRGARAVMALSLALAVIAIGSAILTG